MSIGSPRHLILLALLVSALSPVRANADPHIEKFNSKTLASMMQEWGYKAKIVETSNERGSIQSGSGGISFLVLFYDCETPTSCEDAMLTAAFGSSFEGTIEDTDEWNRNNRHTTAYVSSSGESVLIDTHITLKGGVSKQYLEDYLEMWAGQLSKFRAFLAAAH